MANFRGLPATTCPHCSEVVLRGALRCKNCFEPTEEEKRGSIWGFLLLDVVLLFVLVVGLQSFYRGYPQRNVIIDEESQSVVVIRKYSEERHEVLRLPFSQIKSIESLADQGTLKGNYWTVSVIDLDQNRHEIRYSTKGTLRNYAEEISEIVGKPYAHIDNQKHVTFDKPGAPAPSDTSGNP